jgi:hypothetical protein
MQIIDFNQASIWEQQVILDNKLLTLSCSYNTRVGAWMISVYDLDNKPIVLGKQLTLNTNVFQNIINDNAPSGVLFVYAVAEGKDIKRDNVGTEVLLAYVGNDEVL